LLVSSLLARECAKNEGFSHNQWGAMEDMGDFMDIDTLQFV
jgi:hypothetical protein